MAGTIKKGTIVVHKDHDQRGERNLKENHGIKNKHWEKRGKRKIKEKKIENKERKIEN